MDYADKRLLELEELEEQFKELIKNKQLKEAKALIENLNEVDVAFLIDELDPTTGTVVFRMLPKDIAADVFANFDSEQQQAIIRSSTDAEIKAIMDELYFDDKVDMLEEMPSNVVNSLLKYSAPEERNLINQFLKYPENSAGSLMTIEYVSLKKEMTIEESFRKIKREGIDKETIYTLYVTDDYRRLIGILSLRELIVAPAETKISELMRSEVVYVHTHDDQEDVANLFRKYGFEAIPVVDNEKRIVGIITYDDIIDIIEAETNEDFQVMAAITPSEDEYLETSVLSLAKHRIMWLMVLMISSTITQRIIAGYESYLYSVAGLSTFIPMLMDTGGNSGSQSSTLVIRGLATGDIKPKDWYKVMWKEFRIAMVVGIVLSIISYFKIIYFDKMPNNIALTVSITLIFAVMTAKVVGGALPIAAHKLKLDPAIMASPLITTIADATSLIVYFILAQSIIG
ncbi:MAG: magnesium transporter [Ezakiella sp.]|uniref:magnesium transporter n=1 Tax=Ezakiella sp. TaxID=1935205 RepID=UPI002975E214|nr:magnesium transporter [Ezakiella sp.]MDD7732022.1 magnesium transporter [Eubacteriales bacterium]MDY6079889.1 magnesium transporter [Ezakiella sp.]